MSKTKYKYNPETLSYEEVKMSTKDRLIRITLFALPGVLLLAIGGFLAWSFIPSPEVTKLERENENLKKVITEFTPRIERDETILADLGERDDDIYRANYGIDPYPKHLRNLAVGGTDRYAKYDGYEASELIKETAKKLDLLERQMYAQSKSYDELEGMVDKNKEKLTHIPSINPIKKADLTRLSSGFGMRIHPVYRIPKMHTGVDLTADTGVPIHASGDGVVEKVDYMGGYGKIVIIDHGFGYKTYYAHCHEWKVKKGQKVKRGEVVATVGNTGVSTGPHLHYEVRKKVRDGGRSHYKPVDPVHYFYNDLTPEEYNALIDLAAKAATPL